MDAATMDSTPLAVLHIPSRVPFGFHAAWVTEGQLASQKQLDFGGGSRL